MTDTAEIQVIDTAELQAEATRFVKQMQARYSLSMLEKIYGTTDEYLAKVIGGLLKNGTDASQLKSVRQWLMTGLQPFIMFPPTVEALIQLATLVTNYPVTDYTLSMQKTWYRLNMEYGQRYGNLWKGSGEFDPLHKERVWLSTFEEAGATPDEISYVMERLTRSTVFRVYPPAMEQFMDALLAVRHLDSPLIEEAWLMALSSHPGSDIHPLVRKARGIIGAFEINTSAQVNRGIEQRFKMIYREMLLKKVPVDAEAPKAEPAKYMDRASILSFLEKKA
jgi:hypothetical protein